MPCSISEQSTRACSVLCAANSLCCCPAALLGVWNILLSTNCTQLPNCHDVNSQLTVRGYLTVTMSTAALTVRSYLTVMMSTIALTICSYLTVMLSTTALTICSYLTVMMSTTALTAT